MDRETERQRDIEKKSQIQRVSLEEETGSQG